jgi:7-cyano-7-deazaguanine synthase
MMSERWIRMILLILYVVGAVGMLMPSTRTWFVQLSALNLAISFGALILSRKAKPLTFVVFLSIALGWAEVLGADDIFIGVNAVDFSGYPDCRPEYIEAFERMANLATRAGVEGNRLTIHAPLIAMTKAEIIHTGLALGVDYSATVSCYQADTSGAACGKCESCRLRRQGFNQAGVKDPTRYQNNA